uniref:Pecanex-like protein n=1 Tax=Strongyloides venezuelensis TaxID=75913 RepID=A0A0K0FE19_STRVS
MLRYRLVSYPDLCYIPWLGESPIEFFWKNGSLIYIVLYYSVFCGDCLPVVPGQHNLLNSVLTSIFSLVSTDLVSFKKRLLISTLSWSSVVFVGSTISKIHAIIHY